MISPTPLPPFLFYLVNAAGESYFVDTSGTVQKRGLPSPLGFTPDGWQSATVGWERNLVKFGLIRNYSLALGFVGDGAQILESLYYSTNVDEKVWLLVQKLTLDVTPTDYALSYALYYKGEIDLSTFKHTRRRVEVNIMEGGRSKEIKANEATVYQFPLSARSITVKMDGLELSESGNYILVDDIEIKKSVYGTNFFLPFSFLNKEGSSTGFGFFTQDLADVSGLSWAAKLALDNYVGLASDGNAASINIRIIGTALIKCNENSVPCGFRARFLRSNQLLANQNDYEVIAAFTPVAGQVYSVPVDVTIPLDPGEKLFFEGIYFGGITGSIEINCEFLPDSKFSVAYVNRYRTTYVKAFLPLELYKQIVGKISGDEAFAVSTLLAGSSLAITSGDGLRGISGAFVKTSFNEFTQSFGVLKCAGVGVENEKIVLEARDHFFDDSVIVDLGEVKDLEITPAVDVMFNTIKAGYNDQNIENVNGRLAFNMSQTWGTVVKRISKVLDLVSAYRADPFEIEVTRINFDNKTTTDANTDNANFLLNIDLANPTLDKYIVQRDNQVNGILSGNPATFETISGTAFSSNVDKSEFTFIGFTDEPANISLYIRPGAGGSLVIVSLYKNATILGQVSFIASGFDTNGINASTLLNNGDVIKIVVSIIGGGVYNVVNAGMTIELTSRATYNLKRETYSSVLGLPNPATVFNIEELTPKRILNTWAAWLRGSLLGFDASKITLESATKNRDLETYGGPGGDVIEDADLLVSMLGDPLFAPQKLTFKAVGPRSLVTTLKDTPSACFRFTYKGNTLKGYFIKGSIASKTNQEQNFILLSHPDNDLKPLENE